MKDLVILATGGTFDKDYNPITEVTHFHKRSHMDQILGQCRVSDVPHQMLMLKDSLEIGDQERHAILEAVLASHASQIVITHGTSTMDQTAKFLLGKVSGKTIVLTGAMRPYALGKSDATFNLGCAIMAAQSAPEGVYIAMNGCLFPAGRVEKDVDAGIFVAVD